MTTTKAERSAEVVVFSVLNPSACSGCGEEIGKGELLPMEKARALCLTSADLDHLVYLPAGDPALKLAERECLNDEEQRTRARERAGLARERADAQYRCS